MAKDDLLARIFGTAPDPPATPLSKLLGLQPTPSPILTAARGCLRDMASPERLSKMYGLDEPPMRIPTLGSGLFSALLETPTLRPPVPLPTPTGIRFSDSHFSEPTAFGASWLPMWPGLYAILVLDFTATPRPYRPIYFGKAEDLSARAVHSHEKYDEWCRAAGGAGRLYIAYCSMLGSSDSERSATEESLIKRYAPVCNKAFNIYASLLGY